MLPGEENQMPAADQQPLYRHSSTALLRAAALPLDCALAGPALDDAAACRAWLRRVWKLPGFAEAVRQATPGLAGRVDEIITGQAVSGKRVRRAAVSAVRYLARAVGRPTPFGLFAGVAPVHVAAQADVQWGTGHTALARADTLWLSDIIDRLESDPALLNRLDVTFSSLAVQRGGRLEIWHGPDLVSIRETAAVRTAQDTATTPIAFGVLAGKLSAQFPDASRESVRAMLATLVRQGFLLTFLRAPMTVTDPLAHVVNRLRAVGAATVPSAAHLLSGLEAIHRDLDTLAQDEPPGRAAARIALAGRMRALSPAGRTPLAVDLRLDCHAQLPADVLTEMTHAAGVLLRVSRRGADPEWASFHAAFCDRYGTGTLVPVHDVVDPDTGLGYPADYPGSIQQAPAVLPSGRDERLLALAWGATADHSREVVLSEQMITTLADPASEAQLPPHIEIAARLHATSTAAIGRGEFTLFIGLARSAGTLTSRFSAGEVSADLAGVYGRIPPVTAGAMPVQLSFRPLYPHAENICRVPAYLPFTLPLGEHRAGGEPVITADDLAVTATADQLYLASMSRRQIIEPQVIHALALDKQAPPLARFLAGLPRAVCPVYHEFDWGQQAAQMPCLPRVRYRRSILCPARWRLTTDDLATAQNGTWQQALQVWRDRWQCPSDVDLRDADRVLRLNLTDPAHLMVLRDHLTRSGHALLSETAAARELGWIGGHAHEIAAPLITASPRPPGPDVTALPVLANSTHGHLPGAPGSEWLYVKITTDPARLDELIAARLPELTGRLDGHPGWWFVRYRSAAELDHLRLRIATPADRWAATMAVVGTWLDELRTAGIASRAAFDTYFPETGRYGAGAAMRAAENVFAADSAVVSAALRAQVADTIDPAALTAINMMAITEAFLGGRPTAAEWLISRQPPVAEPTPPAVARQAITWAFADSAEWPMSWPPGLATTWQARAAALTVYHAQLPPTQPADSVLESLLHMHHNRAIGIDPSSERSCRRLARQAMLAWRSQHGRRP
jgi:thiopeptide-type bacteriocin biosynthesis protein